MRYADAAHAWEDSARPVAARSRVLMLRDLGEGALDAIESFALGSGAYRFSLDLHHMGGALARRATTPSAVGHFPSTVFALHTVLHLDPAQDVSAGIRAQDALLDALAPWAEQKTSPGFLTGMDVTEECVRAAYGPSREALLALKAAYDPGDMFRFALPLAPASQP
ncbi:hypothetical protein AB0D66_32640 [Streptomyces sp. NPDC048270]|uniref:hypothetical protein n=1 Tax=Streptomyces sp. NPDC048270 TaxID=3154615 RepID=UPI0033C407D5